MEIHSQHTAGAQGKLTIRVHQPATPGTQAQPPQNLGHPGSGPQPGHDDNTWSTEPPHPASAAGPSGRRRLPWPPFLDWAWPVIENRTPWTHTALRGQMWSGYGAWASPALSAHKELLAFSPSCPHQNPPRTPWVHAAPGIHCLMPVNTPNTSLTAPTTQMRKLRPEHPAKGSLKAGSL